MGGTGGGVGPGGGDGPGGDGEGSGPAQNTFSFAAVQPAAVTHLLLDGMAKGVPEIQNGTQAPFTLILGDHPGLYATTPGYSFSHHGLVSAYQLAGIGH